MSSRLLARHGPETPVCFGPDGGVQSESDLLRDAAQVESALREADRERAALLIFRHDHYAFTAALLGALAAGLRVTLPADTRREVVLALTRHADVGPVLHDTASGAPVRVSRLLGQSLPATVPFELPSDGARLRLVHLSPRRELVATEVALGQLIEEALALSARLSLGPAQRICSGIPPSHRSGLLLGILCPLLCGAAFAREPVCHSSELSRWLEPGTAGTWITVPAQLASVLTSVPAGPASPAASVVVAAVPSAGGLRAACEERLGRAVREVLDDPVAGALLCSAAASEPFVPLAGVTAHRDPQGLLCASGPWGNPSLEQPLATQHEVVARDGGFLSRGRTCDFASVAGQRVALRDAEAALRAALNLRDAALVVPHAGPHAGRVLAWIDPHPGEPGPDLDERVDALLVGPLRPARLLVRDPVPRDVVGETTDEELLRGFGLRPDGMPMCLTLDLCELDVSSSELAGQRGYRVRIPEDYAYFEGHFPGYPILPGAVQLAELVLPCVRQARPDLGPMRGMSQLKFLGRILPGDEVVVLLTFDQGESMVDFTLRTRTLVASTGRLAFAPAGARVSEND